MKPCHTAAAAWWDEASPAVGAEDFQCVHACSIQPSHSAFQHSPRLKILDIFNRVKQTHKQKQSLRLSTGMG